MPHMNGHSNWPPLSRADILLEELRRDMQILNAQQVRSLQETAELRGEMRSGFRTLSANDRELFEQNRDIRDRVTRIEMRRSSGRPHREPAGSRRLTSWLRARTPTLPELVLAALMIAAALGIIAVDRVPWLPQPKPVNASAP